MVVWAGTVAPTAVPLGAPIAMPTSAVIPREDPPQEARARTGSRANPRPDESADHKANHGMLAAPGTGGGRDAHDVFALYGDVGPFFLQCEYFVGDADKFSVVLFHAGLDHNNSLADPQTAQVGPRALLLLSTEHGRETEEEHKNQAGPRSHEA